MANFKQKIFNGTDSYKNLKSVIKKIGAQKIFLVCGNTYKSSFLKDYMESINSKLVIFSEYSPNPSYDEVLKGLELFKTEGCDAIVSVGGGSAIDVAKCVKLFAKMPEGSFYLKNPLEDTGIPHICVPTTAGSGSESTRFAVIYYEGEKQSLAHESIIPEYAILEPSFLKTLPEYQKKATILDALCQAIESIWSVNSTDESLAYAKTSIKMILANIHPYLNGEEDALENISLAANYAGRAINISRTTAPHAMCYKITTRHGIAHGHAVAVCLSYVWRYMVEHIDDCIDPRGKEWLEKAFETLDELFYVNKNHQAVYRFFRLLKYMGVEFPKLADDEDLDTFVSSVDLDRLSNHPIKLGKEALREIYSNIFEIGNNFEELTIDKFLRKYRTLFEVKELQTMALETLKKVDAICKQNGINYFLGEGTLLGAVRHEGFIPWDDDIDILMKREDYDKFISIAQEKLGKDYVLDCFETNPKHWTICAKILRTEKCKFSQKRLEGIGLSTYPGIDIFPLDEVPSCDKKSDNLGRIIRLLKISLWLKTGYSHDYSTPKYAFLKTLSLFVSTKFLHNSIDRLMRKYNGKGGEKLVCYGSLYRIKKERFPKEAFAEVKLQKFEDAQFPIPRGYDEVLRIIYGEYEKLPPYSKRFPKHSFLVDKNF